MATQLLLSQRGTAPQFSAHICCGQMAGWIKMPLGTKAVFGLGCMVLHEDRSAVLYGYKSLIELKFSSDIDLYCYRYWWHVISVMGAIFVMYVLIYLYTVLCTVQCTHIWTDLTVLWIGFCLTEPISLCLDSFSYVCYVYHCILHACVGL